MTKKLKISSRLIRFEGREQYIVLRVTTPDGPRIVGMGLGEVRNEQPFISRIGQESFKRLCDYLDSDISPIIIEIKRPKKLFDRVWQTLYMTTPTTPIFFMCNTPKLYDEVSELLNIQKDYAI